MGRLEERERKENHCSSVRSKGGKILEDQEAEIALTKTLDSAEAFTTPAILTIFPVMRLTSSCNLIRKKNQRIDTERQ
jgi:hypothetical protein